MTCPTAAALLEGWRQSSRHPGYEVHYDGRVRNARTGRVLRPQAQRVRDGVARYVKVNLGKALQVPVHQLVHETWGRPQPDDGRPRVVDHIDNDGGRNVATNLRWLTYSMNTRQWHAMNARYLAAGEAHGWDLGPAVEEDEWAATAARLSASGL